MKTIAAVAGALVVVQDGAVRYTCPGVDIDAAEFTGQPVSLARIYRAMRNAGVSRDTLERFTVLA